MTCLSQCDKLWPQLSQDWLNRSIKTYWEIFSRDLLSWMGVSLLTLYIFLFLQRCSTHFTVFNLYIAILIVCIQPSKWAKMWGWWNKVGSCAVLSGTLVHSYIYIYNSMVRAYMSPVSLVCHIIVTYYNSNVLH